MSSILIKNMKIFSEKLKYYRKLANLKQGELAERLGVKPNTISNYESGKSSPDLDGFVNIIKNLDVSPMKLLGLETTDQSYQRNVLSEPRPYHTVTCPQCELREKLIKSLEENISTLKATNQGLIKEIKAQKVQ